MSEKDSMPFVPRIIVDGVNDEQKTDDAYQVPAEVPYPPMGYTLEDWTAGQLG
jgi:hypothetical protein